MTGHTMQRTMAGNGYPLQLRNKKRDRLAARSQEMESRLLAAPNPAAKLAAAFDWFRGSASMCAKSGAHSHEIGPRNRTAAAEAIAEMIRILCDRAGALDRLTMDAKTCTRGSHGGSAS